MAVVFWLLRFAIIILAVVSLCSCCLSIRYVCPYEKDTIVTQSDTSNTFVTCSQKDTAVCLNDNDLPSLAAIPEQFMALYEHLMLFLCAGRVDVSHVC